MAQSLAVYFPWVVAKTAPSWRGREMLLKGNEDSLIRKLFICMPVSSCLLAVIIIVMMLEG